MAKNDPEQPRHFLKAQVWVFSGDQVLLLRTLPERGGGWQPVTGSIEAGEEPFQGALRELFEETGLRLDASALRDTGHEFEFQSRWGGMARERVWACSLELSDQEKRSIRLDPAEHRDFSWVGLRQAENLLEHTSAKKALILAANLFGKKI